MTSRLTFLSHFVLCLACAGIAFFAWVNGAPQTIWANDMSMMTSLIAVLFVGSAIYLGRVAWMIDSPISPEETERWRLSWEGQSGLFPKPPRRSSFSGDYGHLAERLCVMAGFVGTAIGLSLQAKALSAGSTSFTALATSLFTTASGGTAAAVIAIMTYLLEQGIRRARR